MQIKKQILSSFAAYLSHTEIMYNTYAEICATLTKAMKQVHISCYPEEKVSFNIKYFISHIIHRTSM